MTSDFLVIGGGIAGASAAFFLADHGSVQVLEMESQPGYHSTGRSAALYTEIYGSLVIRALTIGSRPFLEGPPDGFADHPLMEPRGTMLIAREDQSEAFEAALALAQELVPDISEIPVEAALKHCPVLNTGYVARVMYEAGSRDLDVHALHQGYLKALRKKGGTITNDAEVRSLARKGGTWVAETGAGTFEAPVVVNAAGAWADEIGKLAGVKPLGLVPKRRTAFNFDPPEGSDVFKWASVIDVDEQFYWKPDAGKLLGSPADETPVPPQDVQPEELDIAIAVDRITKASTMEIRRIEHSWAGLRTFVEDKVPVAGPAPDADGFVWCAGQGGYGIKTSPSMGRITAAAALGEDMPADLAKLGLTFEKLGPGRLG